MKNILHDIPFQSERMGRRELVNEKDLLLMQIALQPGQHVPAHRANSNVHLLVEQGSLHVDLSGQPHQLKTGDLLPVAYNTPMQISNSGNENAMFLVLKAPNPAEFKKKS